MRDEVIREGGQLGGIAAEAFPLVDGKDDPAVRAWALISRASARTASNRGHTRIRVEIFSKKIHRGRGDDPAVQASRFSLLAHPPNPDQNEDRVELNCTPGARFTNTPGEVPFPDRTR